MGSTGASTAMNTGNVAVSAGQPVDISKFEFTDYRNPDGQRGTSSATYRSTLQSVSDQLEKAAERVINNYSGAMPPARQFITEQEHIFRHSTVRDMVGPSSEQGLKDAMKALRDRGGQLHKQLEQYTKWDTDQRKWVKG